MIPRASNLESLNIMEKIEPGSPFRATRLWNMVVIAFRQMPVKKHWARLQKIEDCFTGSEAVDWMYEYLKINPNFGEKTTREIAVKMVAKLLNHEAFVSASGRDHLGKFKEGQLYKFPSNSHDKALRPLTSYNGHSNAVWTESSSDSKITPEEVWCDEFYYHLAKVLKVDPSVDICATLPITIDVANVIANVLAHTPESADAIPQFVRTAMRALEDWPNTPKGVPNSPGFQRVLIHVVEAFLRGLSHPIVDTASAELLKKCWELLLPSARRRHSISNINLDASSSVESFMMEILDGSQGGNLPDVCFETAFAGTMPETRLVRKRPRSNSLFPTTDFMVPATTSRSESVDYSVPVSLSNSGSSGSSPLMPAVVNSTLFCSDSSLEKHNQGYKEDSFNDLDDQFYTPLGKVAPDVDWDGLSPAIIVDFPELLRAVHFVLLALAPESRFILRSLLRMFEKIFKNNDLRFSEDLTTQNFITQCFSPILFPSSDPVYAHLLILMVVHNRTMFSNVDDFKLRVQLKMKSVGLVNAFCKRITKQEYEQQRTMQNDHMSELLESIIVNGTMNLKEKRKKLKQFQKAYPDVYALRFANSNSEESIFAACNSKPTPRLAKFKSLRM